jgi:type IV pilus assembly protein PilM
MTGDHWRRVCYDCDNPPDAFLVLNIGTDATDLIITNGYRFWSRSLPLGGSQFTEQLAKAQGISFAEAEHLKRHLSNRRDDASNVSLPQVCDDLVTEVVRSVDFYHRIEPKIRIAGLLLFGNGAKLPGLDTQLENGLQVEPIDLGSPAFTNRLTGESVISSPVFQQKRCTFSVCEGLCLQGLGLAPLTTNLLPKPDGIAASVAASARNLYRRLSGNA